MLHTFWMFNIFLQNATQEIRDKIMREMDMLEVETRPVFYPMHTLPPYWENSAYPVADNSFIRGINLPTHRNLSRADQERVVDALSKAINHIK